MNQSTICNPLQIICWVWMLLTLFWLSVVLNILRWFSETVCRTVSATLPILIFWNTMLKHVHSRLHLPPNTGISVSSLQAGWSWICDQDIIDTPPGTKTSGAITSTDDYEIKVATWGQCNSDKCVCPYSDQRWCNQRSLLHTSGHRFAFCAI